MLFKQSKEEFEDHQQVGRIYAEADMRKRREEASMKEAGQDGMSATTLFVVAGGLFFLAFVLLNA